MARPSRNNADYFTHDADMRNDRRVKAIRAHFGAAGYGLLVMLLEVLTDADYTQIDTDDLELELLSGDLGVSVTEIHSLLQLAEKIGFFARNEAGKLICPDLNKALEPVFDKRNRARNMANSGSLSQPVTEIGVSVTETAQSKVKESKEEKSKGKNTLPLPSVEVDAPEGNKVNGSTSNPETKPPNPGSGAPLSPEEKSKKPSLEERREDFRQRLLSYHQQNQEKYLPAMYKAFLNYWAESDGKKMRFEKEKVFEIPNRLATWHQRDQNPKNGHAIHQTNHQRRTEPVKSGGFGTL